MANPRTKTPTLKIISHNVQGLNSPIKRRKFFQLYQSMHTDALFLQETHFPTSYQPTFLHQYCPQFFLASANNKTKGVAICFAKHVNISESEAVLDPQGHFILVSGTIDGELYTFVSYYSPNKVQPHLKGTIFFGGDSNTAFDFSMDKTGSGIPKPKRPTRQSAKIAKLLHEMGLIDIWRETNPHSKDYMHYSAPHSSYARIDHIFTRPSTIPLVISSKIVDSSLSDHSMVTLVTL